MALEIRQNLKLTQSLIMTQKLQQAIKLLQLSRLELEGEIQQILESNPVLEDAEYLGWPVEPPFYVPDEALRCFRQAVTRIISLAPKSMRFELLGKCF